MQPDFRQRLFPFIAAVIFLIPGFQYMLNLPGMIGWFSSNEIVNATIIIGLQIMPAFAIMEFLDWRQGRSPRPPRPRISMHLIPAFLRPACRCLWYVIVGIALIYVAVGFIVVYLSTVVLDAPYKLWVWGLTLVIAALAPWDQAIHFLRQGRRSTET